MTKLNDKQLNAINLIISGKTDTEVAEKIGVSRETVNQWKNKNHDFIAELNKIRNSIQKTIKDRQTAIVLKAYEVLEKHIDKQLESEEVDVKTALEVIKMHSHLQPYRDQETDPNTLAVEEERDKALSDMLNGLF